MYNPIFNQFFESRCIDCVNYEKPECPLPLAAKQSAVYGATCVKYKYRLRSVPKQYDGGLYGW